jgi:hypothetical protein
MKYEVRSVLSGVEGCTIDKLSVVVRWFSSDGFRLTTVRQGYDLETGTSIMRRVLQLRPKPFPETRLGS